ncbi:hypothetical protein KFK09_029340 [Dendrobium nobile]|uniref:Integrase catalytic domain-containing protein n=1 Tax=Dendrobium nobile TaxID=94219 RepID=A0A8T3A535_DENNO|nr:hypothetical protein KFK09_029340 [Dendrobium nobile]
MKTLNLRKILLPIGARKRRASLYLKEVVKEQGVFFIGLLETKISYFDRKDVDHLIGSDWDFVQVPSEGLSGGIFVLWKSNYAGFHLLEASSQLIVGDFEIPNLCKRRIATIYGNKDEAEDGFLSEHDSWVLKVKVEELISTLARLETWWRQRAKVKWMMEVPKSVLDEIDKICRNFIWNKSNGNKGIHYLNWNSMCLPMAYGGRGLHSCSSFVGPLRAKLAWKYMEEKDSLLHRILFPKYGSILDGVSRRAGSASLKILSDGDNSLKPIIKWNVVNGDNIDVFNDTWILDKNLNNCPTFVIPHDDSSFSVSNLITDGRWNEATIGNLMARCKNLKEVFLQIEKWGFHFPVFDSLQEYINWLSNQCSFMVYLYCNVIFFTWKSRNNLIHNGKEDNSMIIGANAVSYSSSMSQRSINFLGKWDANQPSWLSNIHWNPPPPNWLKVNVDASLLPSYKAGIGGVVHDHQGRLLLAFGKSYVHWDISTMEFLATQSIKELIKDWMFKYKGIIIEGDNANVMRFLQDSKQSSKYDITLDKIPPLFMSILKEESSMANIESPQSTILQGLGGYGAPSPSIMLFQYGQGRSPLLLFTLCGDLYFGSLFGSALTIGVRLGEKFFTYFHPSVDLYFGSFLGSALVVGKKLGCEILTIHSDHGGEFENERFGDFYENKEISHNFSAPRTPQQNGVDERKNQTLVEATKAMLAEYSLSKYFWAEAVITACYVLNRVSTEQESHLTAVKRNFRLPFGDPKKEQFWTDPLDYSGGLAKLRALGGGLEELQALGCGLEELWALVGGPAKARASSDGSKKLGALSGGSAKVRASTGGPMKTRASSGDPEKLWRWSDETPVVVRSGKTPVVVEEDLLPFLLLSLLFFTSCLDPSSRVMWGLFIDFCSGMARGIFKDCKGRVLLAFGRNSLHWDIGKLELESVFVLRDFIQGWMLECVGIIIERDNFNVINHIQQSIKKIKWQLEESLVGINLVACLCNSHPIFLEVKYYSTRVVIKGLNHEGNLWYNSCNTCKSKVFIIDGITKCSKCLKENAEYSLRYLIKLRVEDISSSAIFTVFDNEVEQIIGMPVTNLEKIKASNIEDYNNIITKFCDKELIFSVKVQDKQCGNRTFRSITAQSIKEQSDEVIENEPKRIKLDVL